MTYRYLLPLALMGAFTALADTSFEPTADHAQTSTCTSAYEHKMFRETSTAIFGAESHHRHEEQATDTLHEKIAHCPSVTLPHEEFLHPKMLCQEDFYQEIPHKTAQETLREDVQQLHQQMADLASQTKDLAAIIQSMQPKTDRAKGANASLHPGTAHALQTPVEAKELKDLLCQALNRVIACVHDEKEANQYKETTFKDEDTQSAHKTSEDDTLWERTKAYGQKKMGILSEKIKILKAKPWYPVAMFFGKAVGCIVSTIFLLI